MADIVNLITLGRFGNQLMAYLHARAYAEKYRFELRVNPWVGEEVFQLADAHIEQPLPRRTEWTVGPCESNIEFCTCAQTRHAMLYTADDAKRWLQFKPEVLEQLRTLPPDPPTLAHRRMGDYYGYGYVVVSEQSYHDACFEFQLDKPTFVTEEHPSRIESLPHHLKFLSDFYRLTQAKTLLRGNSTFSWCAALLSNATIYAPVIEGHAGGTDTDCQFVRGNWPRLANLEFTQDLHTPPGFTESLRYQYPQLTPSSLVIDLGCYHGVFAAEISRLYGCRIQAYEPVQQFYDIAVKQLAPLHNVVLVHAGIGPAAGTADFTIQGNATGPWASGTEHETVTLLDIATVLTEPVDLIKINIEGGEYDLLESMLDRQLVARCRNIQVQFHALVPDAVARWRAIRRRLCATHHLTFDYPFCWENYALNS